VTQLVAARPQVVSVVVNGNIASLVGPQRSRVVSVVVTFDQPVDLDANALALALHTTDVAWGGVAQPTGYGVLPGSLISTPSTDRKTWTITFAGNSDSGADGLNSLKDGVYDFTINAGSVHPLGVSGVNMAANWTTTFHRLYGDADAPTATAGPSGTSYAALVLTSDNLQYRSAFNNVPGYQSFFDFDGDGTINTGDNLEFRNRFNRPLTWRA
jgi:hypothetical protein